MKLLTLPFPGREKSISSDGISCYCESGENSILIITVTSKKSVPVQYCYKKKKHKLVSKPSADEDTGKKSWNEDHCNRTLHCKLNIKRATAHTKGYNAQNRKDKKQEATKQELIELRKETKEKYNNHHRIKGKLNGA